MIKTLIVVVLAAIFVFVLVFIVALLRMYLSVSSYSKYWQARAADTVPSDAFVYIAIGDSAAQGIGANHPSEGYVGVVAAELSRKIDRPVHVVNLSATGAKMQDAIHDQLPRLANYPEPDLITVEMGANDLLSYQQSEFRDSFSELLRQLPKSSIVSNIPSFRGSRAGRLYDTSKEASSIADELIEQAGLLRVDLFSTTNNLGYRDFAVDWFHPNSHAYRQWAKAFLEAADKQLK